MTNVAIINLHRNNLGSLIRAFKTTGADVICTDKPSECSGVDCLVLPGVGSFYNTIQSLTDRGELGALRELAETCSLTIGICLGMQLFATSSTEGGNSHGLDVVPGEVYRLPEYTGAKVPNIGWRRSEPTENFPLDAALLDTYFYHVHSYYFQPSDGLHVYATAVHGDLRYPTIVGKGRIFGMQFHPEISSQGGATVLSALLAHFL